MSKELTYLLDEFLDNSEDIEIQQSFIETIKRRTVYSFISVLYYISYPRIDEILKKVCELIQSERKPKEEAFSISEEQDSSSTPEDDDNNYKTGTLYDLLQEE